MSITLTRRGAVLLIAAFVLAGLWWTLELHDLLSLIALLVSFELIAVVMIVVGTPRGKSFSSVQVSTPTPEAGQNFKAWSRFPLLGFLAVPTEAHWEFQGHDIVTQIEGRGSGRGAYRTYTALAACVGRTRGESEVTLRTVVLEDPLGLIRRTIKPNRSSKILVVPRLLVSDESFDKNVTVENLHGGTPGGSIRKYQHGDAMKQVHWKQSARQGELLVNEPDREHVFHQGVHLITDRHCYETVDEFEYAVSAAATESVRAIERGRSVRLQVGDGEPTEMMSITEVLLALAYVQLSDAKSSRR